MSVHYWIGAGNDGDFSNAANWFEVGVGAGSAPGASDDAIIAATDQDIDAGLTNAFALATLTITPGFGGKIGSASAALTLTGITTRLRYAGRGAWAKFAMSGGGTCAEVSMEHTGNGVVYLGAGTWTLANNGTGGFVVQSDAIVTTLNNAGGTGHVAYKSDAITTCSNAGRLTVNRPVTTANVLNGGTLIHQNNGSTTYTSVTTANVHGGGTYNKRSGGTDTTVNIFPRGKFTTAGASANAAVAGGVVTLTTVNLWSLGVFERDRVPGFSVTVITLNRVGASANDVA